MSSRNNSNHGDQPQGGPRRLLGEPSIELVDAMNQMSVEEASVNYNDIISNNTVEITRFNSPPPHQNTYSNSKIEKSGGNSSHAKFISQFGAMSSASQNLNQTFATSTKENTVSERLHYDISLQKAVRSRQIENQSMKSKVNTGFDSQQLINNRHFIDIEPSAAQSQSTAVQNLISPKSFNNGTRDGNNSILFPEYENDKLHSNKGDMTVDIFNIQEFQETSEETEIQKKIEEHSDDSFAKKCKVVIKLGLPAIFSIAMFNVQVLTNIYFVSHLGKKHFISAVGLGNMILNSVVISVLDGFNSNIETLVSQAGGTGNLEICGVYLNRAILVMTIAYIMLQFLIVHSEEFLIYIHMPEQVAKYTQEYLVNYIPGMYFYALCDLYRRFLNCFQKNILPMMSFFIAVMLHPYWINYFMHEKGMGYNAIPMAGLVTNFTNFFLIYTMYACQSDLKETRVRFDCRMFQNLGIFITLGLPMIFQSCVDYLEWEQMTLVACYISIKEQASLIILLSLYSVAYSTGYGMQSPGCTMIGLNIGKCNIPKAKEYLKAIFYVFACILLMQMSAFWYFRFEIIAWMTNIEELRECLHSMFLIFILNQLVDVPRGMLRGPIKGLGLQKDVAWYCVLLQGISMPIFIYVFTFEYNLRMVGLWASKMLVDFLLLLCYGWVLLRADWNQIALDSIKRQMKDKGRSKDQSEADTVNLIKQSNKNSGQIKATKEIIKDQKLK